ncbi:hypothetical protein R1flu_025945 [Riccia fluitans]|uniref:Uncharacterized protein n=1 Tax=Riccia fluitans TaxID=41844 RepID=A0ABD1Y032_9MARC
MGQNLVGVGEGPRITDNDQIMTETRPAGRGRKHPRGRKRTIRSINGPMLAELSSPRWTHAREFEGVRSVAPPSELATGGRGDRKRLNMKTSESYHIVDISIEVYMLLVSGEFRQ